MPAIYIVLSHTGTWLSRLIRWLTGSKYTHVSLAFDPNLKNYTASVVYVPRIPLKPVSLSKASIRTSISGFTIPIVKLSAFKRVK